MPLMLGNHEHYCINYKMYLHITETHHQQSDRRNGTSINYKLYLHITETLLALPDCLPVTCINYKLYLHITETDSGKNHSFGG